MGNVKICVINLDDRSDRLAKIAQGLADCGVSFQRISAVHYESLTEYPSMSVLRSSYAANWMSHQLALEAISNSSDDFGLILEDDAALAGSLITPKKLGELELLMKTQGIDLLQVGHISNIYKFPSLRGILDFVLAARAGRITRDRDSGLFFVRRNYRAGSHCYLVSKETAIRLSGLNLPVALATDPFYMALAENGEGLHIARLSKSLVEQESRQRRQDRVDSDLG